MASPNGGIEAAEKLHQKLEGSDLRNVPITHICPLIMGEMYHPDSILNPHKKIRKMLTHYDAGFTLRTYTQHNRNKMR